MLLPEGEKKQPGHEHCWLQACPVPWRLSTTQLWLAGERQRGRKRDGGKERGHTSGELSYMCPRNQQIHGRPGRSYLDLGSRIPVVVLFVFPCVLSVPDGIFSTTDAGF